MIPHFFTSHKILHRSLKQMYYMEQDMDAASKNGYHFVSMQVVGEEIYVVMTRCGPEEQLT